MNEIVPLRMFEHQKFSGLAMTKLRKKIAFKQNLVLTNYNNFKAKIG